MPSGSSSAAAGPPGVRHQPDREVCPGAAVVHLGQAQLVQGAPARGQLRGPLAPGSDRVRLVEAHRRGDRSPETLGVRFAEYLPRPARVRRRDHGPAQPLPEERLLVGHRLVHPDSGGLRRIDVVEQVRVRIADERDDDAPLGRPFLDPLDRPRPRLGQRLDARMGEPRVPDRAVGPLDLDPRGPGGVGALHHGPGDLQVSGIGGHQDTRARLDVDADPDDQVGEAVEAIVVGHAGRVGHSHHVGRPGARKRRLALEVLVGELGRRTGQPAVDNRLPQRLPGDFP